MTNQLPMAWPLVGRTEQLDHGLALLRSGRGVLLAGEAGIGKTAVARVLADALDDDGVEVARLAATVTTGLPIETLSVAASAPATTDRVIVLDDMQLLDDDAAALVHRLTVEGRVTLLGTLRTGEPHPPAVTALWKDDLVERMDLQPLERTEVDRLIDLVLDGPVDAGARRTLWDLTLGWPLMFRELIRASTDTGLLQPVNGLWRFNEPPASTRLDELIGSRLDDLGPAELELVELLSLGEPIGFDLLRMIAELDSIDEAERSGVIEVVTDGMRRDARLAHPIFGDVARRRMTAARRSVLSARLLGVIESTPMRRRDDVVRATTWQLQAGGTTVTDDMVLAARRALYAREQRLAVDLATRALMGDPSRKDVALLLAEALISAGEPTRAEQFASEAADGAVGEKDQAVLTMQRAFTLFWGFGDAEAAEHVVTEALDRIPSGPWHDELLGEQAVLLSNQGRHREAAAITDPLLARDDLGDRAFITASISACCSRSLDGRCLDALTLCSQAYTRSEAMGPAIGMTKSGIFIVSQVTALTEAGRLADAELLARGARDFALAEGETEGQAWFAMSLGRVLLTSGRFEEAERCFIEGSAAFAGIHSHGPRHWSLAGAVMAAASRGDLDGARAHDEERRVLPAHPAAVMAAEVGRASAYVALVEGDRSRAIRLLRETISANLDDRPMALLSGLVHDIVRFGGTVEPDEAERYAACEGDLVPARLALIEAHRRGDAEALEQVAATFTELGSPLFSAEAALLAARCFSQAGDKRAEARCRRMAAASRAELGDGPIVTLDLHGGPSADLLTRREREVAELAAAGHTNKEIGEALYVSVRTVENHLQRVYDKLGAGGRRELAAALGL